MVGELPLYNELNVVKTTKAFKTFFFSIIIFYSRHLHKISVKTNNHQVRINYHTWEVK